MLDKFFQTNDRKKHREFDTSNEFREIREIWNAQTIVSHDLALCICLNLCSRL